MKNRFIKILLLLFSISLLLTSCNQDELDIVAAHEQGVKAEYQKRKITFSELQTKLNKYSSFGELQAKADGNFITSLDLDNVIEFSSEEKTTYTIKANTVDESSSKTTNLIIEEQNDELTYYLMRYIPSLRYVQLNNSGNSNYIPFDGIIQMLTSDGVIITEKLVVDGITERYSQDCEINVEYILGDCSCPNDPSSDPHEATDCCDGPPIIGIIIDIDCEYGGGGSNNDGNNGNGNPFGDGNPIGGGSNDGDDNDDTGNNGNNTTNEDIPQIPTEPIFGETSENDIASMFNEFLDSNNQITQSQINWIYSTSENTIIGQQVYNLLYLGANSGQDYSNIDLDLLDTVLNSGDFDIDDERPNAKEVALFVVYNNQAPLHIQNSITALSRAQVLAPNFSDGINGLEDGKADAFRHAYWNALGTAEFGQRIMKLFADAHEWNKSGTAVTMDFHNNKQGRDISIENNFGFITSSETISNTIELAVINGRLKYINNNNLVFTNQ